MLYALHEMHHAALTPFRLTAEAFQHLFTSPWIPASYTGFGRTVAASCELLERTTRKYEKPSFGLKSTIIDGVAVKVHEERTVISEFCTLVRFVRGTDERDDPKLLIVAPMSGHNATLLRGTVASMLPDHDVTITDWTNARDVPIFQGSFDFDDFIESVITVLRHLGPNTHVMSVCQPSTPVLAAVALMAADDDFCQPASMILLGGPIDTRENPTAVNEVAQSKPLRWFKKNVIHQVPFPYPGAGRLVYPGFVQLTGFMSMNLDRHLDAHFKLYEHLVGGDGDSAEQHRVFYNEYLSVMDLTAEFYLQTIKMVFQEHALPRGGLVWRGRKVNPARIKRTALMTVEGENDDITGPGQCQAAHRLCSSLPDSMRRHHLQEKVGHYGVFNGRRWREEILPNVRDFIRFHDAVLESKAS